MLPFQPVEPQPPSLLGLVESLLRDLGEDAHWLAAEIIRAARTKDDESEEESSDLYVTAERSFKRLVLLTQELRNKAAALTLLTHYVERELTNPIGHSRWDHVLKAASAKGWNFYEALKLIQTIPTTHPTLIWITPYLSTWDRQVRYFAVRLYAAEVIDLRGLLAEALADSSLTGQSWAPQDYSTSVRSPRRDREDNVAAPVFWLIAVGDSVASKMAEVIQIENDPEMIRREAFGFVCAISEWMTSPIQQVLSDFEQCEEELRKTAKHPDPFFHPDKDQLKSAYPHNGYRGGLRLHPQDFDRLEELVRKSAEIVESRYSAAIDVLPESPLQIRALALRLMRMAYAGRYPQILDQDREQVLQRVKCLASGEIGRMRTLFRRANTDEAAAEFTTHETASIFSDSCALLFSRLPLWDAWKHLLLAFRSLNAPSLGPDLSFWEGLEKPWSIWAPIPSSIVMIFHHRAHYEQHSDRTLETFREQFGRYCLDALKTHTPRNKNAKEKEAGPREKDPVWRYFYIRAARELRNNPGGDGQHTLHFASQHDPDEQVREAAKVAYKEVSEGERLGDMSPRRAVLYAFWWLEQAHMKSLGREIDPAGAQRTRERMVRLTTESTTPK